MVELVLTFAVIEFSWYLVYPASGARLDELLGGPQTGKTPAATRYWRHFYRVGLELAGACLRRRVLLDVGRRIDQMELGKGGEAQAAGVATTTGAPHGIQLIAGARAAVIYAGSESGADDFCLAQML